MISFKFAIQLRYNRVYITSSALYLRLIKLYLSMVLIKAHKMVIGILISSGLPATPNGSARDVLQKGNIGSLQRDITMNRRSSQNMYKCWS